ncbi:MAG: hypothetical protein JSR59_00210 [Proteobacteria bacterium]|nr:hypothetical protein [Pseudomonadota bacterium]
MKPHICAPRRLSGAAALVVTLLLFFAMVLGVLFVNRNLIFEQRASANQYRATQAFEAAEAGLEWALAALNADEAIGSDCRASGDPKSGSFRDRYLLAQHGAFVPVTAAGAALRPSCVRGDDGWSCSCPDHGAPTLTRPADDVTAPAFTLQFAAGPKPGTVRAIATGCSRLAAPCLGGPAGTSDAGASHEVLLGLLPGLRTPPAAALTVRGSVGAGLAALGVHNADPATALAIDAGGAIDAAALRITAPAGGSIAASLAPADTALAARTPADLFTGTFGLPPERWQVQPGVRRIRCDQQPCNALVSGDAAQRLTWIDGDARLSGPLTLGSPSRPVILVASGSLELTGDVVIHGLVYAGALTWNDTSGRGALLRGAAISSGDYQGNGTPDIVRDAAILAALHDASGGFARIAGSWRDF